METGKPAQRRAATQEQKNLLSAGSFVSNCYALRCAAVRCFWRLNGGYLRKLLILFVLIR
jgi:hypothetical protein